MTQFNPQFKRVHTFPKGICLKVNVIARLAFELAYYNSAIKHFNHYTTSPTLLLEGVKDSS